MMKHTDITERLRSVLAREEIDDYLISVTAEESVELYYIKKALDTKRSTDTLDVTVTVYRRFAENGREYRGSARVIIFPSMTDGEISKRLRCGYDACLYIKDEVYPPAPPVRDVTETEDGGLDSIALRHAEAMLSADCEEGAFLNSAEIFAKRRRTRILTPHGVDVSYGCIECSGEFVTSSKEEEDVELYDHFRYEGDGADALRSRVSARLCETRDRSRAKKLPRAGTYPVILEGECVREILGYALWRGSAKNVYTGYSSASVGEPVGGALPNITARATEPYSAEGIRMRDIPLVRGGRLCSLVGGMRFCSYLGCEGTGVLEGLTAESGSIPADELHSDGCLSIVSFSDFQFDPLDGYFGGEVRLAYLMDGDKRIPVTGFSISGNYRDTCDSFVFSAERVSDYYYDGPRFMKISGVTAG